MTPYRHTQIGTMTRVVIGLALLLVVAVIVPARGHPAALLIASLVAAVLVVCLYIFRSLTVEVDERGVSARFGGTALGKRFATSRIRDARPVRNRWFFGWGIRWYFRGWLYNVSGLDAVELTLDDGRLYRIGTDQPRELTRAIREAAGLPPPDSLP